MKQIFTKKQIIFKLVFSFLFLISLVIFYKAWQNSATLIVFVLAYSVGVVLLYLDEQFLYKLYVEKIDNGEESHSHFPALASRNFFFILMLPFLSIFVLTSSGSVLGIALILAINFYLLIEMWQLRDEFLLFKDRFFALSKIKTNSNLVHKISWIALFYFVFLLIILYF
ncbi:hypothetical protein KKI22_00495 [Patescibacteria group bacterium]|nr:hypothetical protein [Patescibacteria group bacterium]